jgi:hypothetical protein
MKASQTFKKLKLIVSSFFIFLVHLPFVFAKSKTKIGSNAKKTAITYITDVVNDSLIKPVERIFVDSLGLYDQLKLRTIGLSKQVFDYSILGFQKMVSLGKVEHEKIISIVDFSQPSANKRLYIIDLEEKKVLFNTYVAHGKNSGTEMATSFSNTPTSNKSSLGFYVTSHTYNGKNGLSLQLDGQEQGINDNALARGIVMHSASYVNEGYIQSQGWIGRSQGCPAVMPELNKPIVETIKEGSCFFIYSPDENYIKRSAILN